MRRKLPSNSSFRSAGASKLEVCRARGPFHVPFCILEKVPEVRVSTMGGLLSQPSSPAEPVADPHPLPSVRSIDSSNTHRLVDVTTSESTYSYMKYRQARRGLPYAQLDESGRRNFLTYYKTMHQAAYTTSHHDQWPGPSSAEISGKGKGRVGHMNERLEHD